jgi:hypothetical protein
MLYSFGGHHDPAWALETREEVLGACMPLNPNLKVLEQPCPVLLITAQEQLMK